MHLLAMHLYEDLVMIGRSPKLMALRFNAPNAPPYPFEWVNYDETRLDYAAALTRISATYQQRF